MSGYSFSYKVIKPVHHFFVSVLCHACICAGDAEKVLDLFLNFEHVEEFIITTPFLVEKIAPGLLWASRYLRENLKVLFFLKIVNCDFD